MNIDRIPHVLPDTYKHMAAPTGREARSFSNRAPAISIHYPDASSVRPTLARCLDSGRYPAYIDRALFQENQSGLEPLSLRISPPGKNTLAQHSLPAIL